MWKNWIDERMNLKWLSDGMKKSILAQYDESCQRWGRLLLSQIKSKQTDVVDLAGGTQRGYTKPPEHVLETIHKGIDEGSFEYPKDEKVAEFRYLVAEKLKDMYGLDLNPRSEIALCVGASTALDAALRIFVNPGDEVIIMDPDYATYEAQAASYNAKVISVPLKEVKPGEWDFNFEDLEKRVSQKTKLLMISNANNPTSYLYTEKNNEDILELANKNDFYILSDQVSEEILFDGAKYHSIASLPEAMNRTIMCSSFSKLYCLSGLRIGYIAANNKIIEQLNQIIGWTTDGIVTPGVDAGIAVLKNKEKTREFIKNTLESLRKRRDYMNERLGKMEGVIPNNPKGLYWAFPNVKSFKIPTQQLAEFLMQEEKVYVRPGTWYGRNGEGHFRISFCMDPEWIRKGMDRMESGLEKISKKII